MVATDVDGTLTRAGALDPEVVIGIADLVRAGVEVLLVSGRAAGEIVGLVRYLPGVRRGIAENGLVLLVPDEPPQWLGPTPNRDALKAVAMRLNERGAGLRLAPDDPFRLGDVAYERDARSDEALEELAQAAHDEGAHMIWSSVHVHFTPSRPDKGTAVAELARRDGFDPRRILTIGDAPNDAGLFAPDRFGMTVGTADVSAHRDHFEHLPEYVTSKPEGAGFMEVVSALLAARSRAR